MGFTDIVYEKKDHIAKIVINRPNVLNAMRTKTVEEMVEAFQDAGSSPDIGVVLFTGAGDRAFCVGGDAKEVSGRAGYSHKMLPTAARLHLLIREIPQPVICVVKGYAIGGGHVLHLLCDITLAAENAIFGQVGPSVGSFDAAFGSIYLARIVGEKKAREIWYFCRRYSAKEAYEMGLVNKVVPLSEIDKEAKRWCDELLSKSQTAIRFLKASFNLDTDYISGLQKIAYGACWLYYHTDEAFEGRRAYLEKRSPDFKKFLREDILGW